MSPSFGVALIVALTVLAVVLVVVDERLHNRKSQDTSDRKDPA